MKIYNLPVTFSDKPIAESKVGFYLYSSSNKIINRAATSPHDYLCTAWQLELLEEFLALIDGRTKKGQYIVIDKGFESFVKGCGIKSLATCAV